jgi:cation transport protein ChaC
MPELTEDLIARRLPRTRQPRQPAPTLAEDLLRAGLAGTLAGRAAGEPVRLFAYGALMWERSAVPGAMQVDPARLDGFARRGCLRDVHNRGTPDAPGLTLGLEAAPGTCCEGLLFTLPAEPEAERAALWSAWRHEMTPGFHRHAWLVAAPPGAAPARALTFVAEERHALYAGGLPEAEQADILARAVGPQGPDAEYLRLVVGTLASHGLDDAAMTRLARAVAGRLASSPDRP